MSKTLDLTGYSLEVVGRDLRMKPNANGYGGALLWALLMDVFLLHPMVVVRCVERS